MNDLAMGGTRTRDSFNAFFRERVASCASMEHYAGSLSDLRRMRRKDIVVNGKSIFLIYVNGQVFAMDRFCYHAGGPLHQGDIEDVSGRTCIVCPWHKYKIVLGTGEGLYHSIDPHNLSKPPKLRSKGVKQRCHEVKVEHDAVYVILSTSPQVESDVYNKEAEGRVT